MPDPRQPNQIDYVELPAESAEAFAQAKAFYEGVFGWTYTAWGEDYADTKASGVGSGLNADPAHRPACPLVVLYSPDLEAVRAEISRRGGPITRDIFAFPGGRRFHFRDPAGNELAVWSDK